MYIATGHYPENAITANVNSGYSAAAVVTSITEAGSNPNESYYGAQATVVLTGTTGTGQIYLRVRVSYTAGNTTTYPPFTPFSIGDTAYLVGLTWVLRKSF